MCHGPIHATHTPKPSSWCPRVLAKPFVRKSATDEVKALGSITALLATLGQVFVGAFEPSLQQAAAQVRTAQHAA